MEPTTNRRRINREDRKLTTAILHYLPTEVLLTPTLPVRSTSKLIVEIHVLGEIWSPSKIGIQTKTATRTTLLAVRTLRLPSFRTLLPATHLTLLRFQLRLLLDLLPLSTPTLPDLRLGLPFLLSDRTLLPTIHLRLPTPLLNRLLTRIILLTHLRSRRLILHLPFPPFIHPIQLSRSTLPRLHTLTVRAPTDTIRVLTTDRDGQGREQGVTAEVFIGTWREKISFSLSLSSLTSIPLQIST